MQARIGKNYLRKYANILRSRVKKMHNSLLICLALIHQDDNNFFPETLEEYERESSEA